MKSFFTLLMAICFTAVSYAQSTPSAKKYLLKPRNTEYSILYIKDISTENDLHAEPADVTKQRFNAITGVSNFERTGNGFFRMEVKNTLVNEILLRNFHFTETEIAETAKVNEIDFK